MALGRPPVPRGRRAFLVGLTSGVVYFSGTLYWLVETMTTFGGLAVPVAVFAAGVLVAYLSLFPALFALVVSRMRRTYGPRGLFIAPAAWVATELGRQYVWDGFPWALLGYSQITLLPVAQLASIAGVYGLSGLLAVSATAAAYIVLDRSRLRWQVGAAVAASIAGLVWWGGARLQRSDLLNGGEAVRVAVIQGNIAQNEKWDPALRDAITDRYLSMTRQALRQGASFVMWPESSTPFYFEHDVVRGGQVRRLAREAGVTLLIGSDQVEPVKTDPAATTITERNYNAAFLVKPDGTVGGVYRKMHLVPFGEYVPLQSVLFFAGPIIGAVADFAPFTRGDSPVLLPVGAHLVSTAICYEVIYPNLMRRFVQDGSALLTTITNDAWYGRSSAAYQHWDQASMRAIEEGRYLARAANTGISGFVDPYGRVLARTQLFEAAIAVRDVRFLTARTIYSRIGDVVAWLSLALTIAALAATLTSRYNRQ